MAAAVGLMDHVGAAHHVVDADGVPAGRQRPRGGGLGGAAGRERVIDADQFGGDGSEVGQPDRGEFLLVHERFDEVQVLAPVDVGIEQVLAAADWSAGRLVEVRQVMRMVAERRQAQEREQRQGRAIEPGRALRQRGAGPCAEQHEERQDRQHVADAQLHRRSAGDAEQQTDRQQQEQQRSPAVQRRRTEQPEQQAEEDDGLRDVRQLVLQRSGIVVGESGDAPLAVEKDGVRSFHDGPLCVQPLQIVPRQGHGEACATAEDGAERLQGRALEPVLSERTTTAAEQIRGVQNHEADGEDRQQLQCRRSPVGVPQRHQPQNDDNRVQEHRREFGGLSQSQQETDGDGRPPGEAVEPAPQRIQRGQREEHQPGVGGDDGGVRQNVRAGDVQQQRDVRGRWSHQDAAPMRQDERRRCRQGQIEQPPPSVVCTKPVWMHLYEPQADGRSGGVVVGLHSGGPERQGGPHPGERGIQVVDVEPARPQTHQSCREMPQFIVRDRLAERTVHARGDVQPDQQPRRTPPAAQRTVTGLIHRGVVRHVRVPVRRPAAALMQP